MRSQPNRRAWLLAGVAAWAAGYLPAAAAAVPTGVALEGALNTSSGGPASDGNYAVTFNVYEAQTGGSPL